MTAILPHNVDVRKTTFSGLAIHTINGNVLNMTETPYATIGERLQKIREGFSDLPQKSWAEKHGFNVTQYNNWERGVRRIPLESAERLCNLYGLTLDAIYRGRLDGLSENARKAF